MLTTVTALLGVLFFMAFTLYAYRLGLMDGLRLQRGQQIEPIKTPLQVIDQRKERKETKKQDSLVQQGINNIFAYDGNPQKGGEKT